MKNMFILVFIIILLCVIKTYEHDKKFAEYDRKLAKYERAFTEYNIKIDESCKSIENFVVNLDDKTDATAISNLLSLAKGEQLKVKSLIITGDMKVSGSLNVDGDSTISGNNTIVGNNTVGKDNRINGNNLIVGNDTINGHLSVKNGSDFSGGTHTFKDAESKNNQYIRIGNPWGIPGIHVPDNAPIVIGNNGVQNLYALGGETKINNGNFIFKDNRLQYPAGGYELNFGNDGWIRMLQPNTGDGNAYAGNGIAQKSIYVSQGGVLKGNFDGDFVMRNNMEINGKLTVRNGSEFSGGNHIFKDAESKNGEWIRIGNPWGTPGLHTNAAELNIGNGNRNIYIKDNITNINGVIKSSNAQIGRLVIVDNKIQFPEAGYELALGGDQWVRTNKLNAAQGPAESYIGGFAGNQLWCKDRLWFIDGHYIRTGPLRMVFHNRNTLGGCCSGDNIGPAEFGIDVTNDSIFRYWSHNGGSVFRGRVEPDAQSW